MIQRRRMGMGKITRVIKFDHDRKEGSGIAEYGGRLRSFRGPAPRLDGFKQILAGYERRTFCAR